MDLTVAAAGAITYALLLHHLAVPDHRLHGYLAELAVGMAVTLILLQIVIAGASRGPIILLLLIAMVLRQAAGAEQLLALVGPEAAPHWVLSPAPAWLLFATTICAAAWIEQRPVKGWAQRGCNGFSPGSWTVPGLCMALGTVVLAWLRHPRR